MAIIRCPHCGTANREGSNFCNSCGAVLHLEDLIPEPDTLIPEEGSEPIENDPTESETEAETTQETEQEPKSETEEPPEEIADALTRTRTSEEFLASEPWLQMEFTEEEDAPPFDDESEHDDPDIDRLAASVTGLLTPVSIEVSGDDAELQNRPSNAAVTDNQVELWRNVRARMATPPLLAGLTLTGSRPSLPNMNTRWLFLVLLLAVTIPAFFTFAWPSSSVSTWPGVEEAFDAIDALPHNSHVRVFWAYDPSTAGELDLAALPVMTHLFQQRTRISVISQLPGGPAVAYRLLEQARLSWQSSEELTIAAESSWGYPIAYLPGGASVLALLARDPDSVFDLGPLPSTEEGRESAFEDSDLTIVMAAQADDVQHWLEQVQPLTHTPVVAVVAAGADPVVRPYLDSGQLVGLVSGYDGAFNYQRMLDEQAKRNSTSGFDQQLVLQDWGQFVFFLTIVLGNFAAVIRRSDRDAGP